MITLLTMIGFFGWEISKLEIILSFFTTHIVYLCSTALILFIHVGFLEYLSFKHFKLIDKICISKGQELKVGLRFLKIYLDTLYGSVIVRVGRVFTAPLVFCVIIWNNFVLFLKFNINLLMR
jgi:hypothetical protein